MHDSGPLPQLFDGQEQGFEGEECVCGGGGGAGGQGGGEVVGGGV